MECLWCFRETHSFHLTDFDKTVLFSSAALNAKALHYNETLCKTEDVQKFLCGLVSKPPEVGHYVTCFHDAKADSSTSGGGGGGASAGGGGNKTSGGSTAPRQVGTHALRD